MPAPVRAPERPVEHGPGGLGGTQINASNGALIRVLSGGDYDFGEPSGIAVFGAYLFITNISANSVDVISAANGSLERIISGPEYGFDDPNSITILDGIGSLAGGVTVTGLGHRLGAGEP